MPTSAEVPFELRIDENESRVRVHLRGELDMSTAPDLLKCLQASLDRGLPAVVLDISEMSFSDSQGLSVLIRVHKLAVANGTRFSLVAPTPSFLKLLSVAGLSDYFDLDGSV